MSARLARVHDLCKQMTAMVGAAKPGYSELERDAVTSDLLGVPVRVCSLEHLRRMKKARSGTQDIADLERLPPLD